MKRLLVRYGRFNLSVGPCPGQKRPAFHRRGSDVKFWVPGWSLSIWFDPSIRGDE